ncbi:hypothetical protein, partial [Xanthomonas campestris]|uniref:hypothetical protein n=1 Tax=Xanthomonas campestris TaxID=339 RepID=UPI001C4A1C61
MVVSNILLRTFFIKAEAYGTAFTLEIDGEEFLVLRATSLVAPEKPPITQRPQGLDVCSGVPELP